MLHHRPLGQLSIFIFSGTGLQDPRTNARFRCKNSDFQAGYKTPQSPPQRDLPRTNRPVGHALSSAPSYDLLSTSPYLIVQHRLANLSEKCKISMQDKRIITGCIPRENPAVTPFAADESASGSRPCECSLFDLLSNAPYCIPCAACVCGVHFIIAKPARAVNAKPRGGDRAL